MFEVIGIIQNFLWQFPLPLMLLLLGLGLTIQLRAVQFRQFGKSLRLVFIKGAADSGDLSPFQSLMTALAGSIGTGNITGIATAVAVGGFGALFWMWLMALLGMATAYTESYLSIKYREKNALGLMSGGPMYVLKNAVNYKGLALTNAFLAAISALGIGCLVQSNSVVDAITYTTNINPGVSAMGLTLITGAAIIGGVKSIGRVAGFLVPLMALCYIISGLYVLIYFYAKIPYAFFLIISSAFTGQAAAGAFVGSTLLMAIQNGVQYGIFANEAGLGSLSIAAASARTNSPHNQGLIAAFGVFFSTLVICTITGLVLAVTDVLGSTNLDGSLLKGSALAIKAFSGANTNLSWVVVFGLILFSFTTMLGWCYYGEKCLEYIFGVKIILPYRICFIGVVFVGALVDLNRAWSLANLASALMALPNILAMFILRKRLRPD
jgi:AGCS family alanine or glycine:cation symporter